jgi:hypothetical protein
MTADRFEAAFVELAGVTGLEPAASGVTGHLISQGNQGLFRLLGCANVRQISKKLEQPLSPLWRG